MHHQQIIMQLDRLLVRLHQQIQASRQLCSQRTLLGAAVEVVGAAEAQESEAVLDPEEDTPLRRVAMVRG